MSTEIALTLIRRDGGTQPRGGIDADVVADYAEQYGAQFGMPNVIVYHDGTDYWLADGFHRIAAAEQAGLTFIHADVKQGTRRDAVLYACGANASHGLRRSAADKRRAVQTMLDDGEWRTWSSRRIAEQCRVSVGLVESMRKAAPAPAPAGASVKMDRQPEVRQFERGGKVHEMTVRQPAPKPAAEPMAPAEDPFAVGGDDVAASLQELEDLKRIVDAAEPLAEARKLITDLRRELESKDRQLAAALSERNDAIRQVATLKRRIKELEG